MPNKQFKLITNELTIIDEEVLSSSFVETFVWEPSNNKEVALGNLYILGQIFSLRDKKENARLLSKIARITKDEYYKNPSREPSSSLKLSLKRLNSFLEKNKKHYLLHSLKINLIISVIAGKDIFVARLGEGAIFAIRDRGLIPINTTKVYLEPDRNGFIDVVKGTTKENDIIILATPQVFKVGKDKIAKMAKTSQIIPFVLKNEKDFKNLGLITIRVSPIKKPLETTETSSATTHTQQQELEKQKIVTRKNLLGRLSRGAVVLFTIIAVVSITTLALKTQKNNNARKTEAKNTILEMENLRAQASSLLSLENFKEAEKVLDKWTEELERLKELNILKQETEKAEASMTSVLFEIKRYEELGAKEIINLENNTVNFDPAQITRNKEGIVIFNENKLYTFNTNKSSGNFQALPESIPFIRDVVYTEQFGNAPFFLTADSILKYDDEAIPIANNDTLGVALSLGVYNDNLYVLTPEAIWFVAFNTRELVPWTKTDIFSQAKDFTIDKFIYILENTTLHKLLNGQKNIEIKVDDGIEKIFTSKDFVNIYLLNPHNGQMVVMDKFGNVEKRITNSNLKGATSFTVSDNEKTLFFLKEKRVFSISL